MKKEAVDTIFKEKMDFIIIALTGQTGSGCSTAAQILRSSFEQVAVEYNQTDYNHTDMRKNNIICNYAKKNWVEFEVIEVKNIITTFVLDKNVNDFINYAKEKFLYGFELDDEFKTCFDTFHKKREDIQKEVSTSLGVYDESVLIKEHIYDFYFKELPQFTNQLKVILENISKELYVKMYQHFGRNIRLSGNAYQSELIPQNVNILSQRINKLIKILRKRNLDHINKHPGSSKGVRVVIDALRNPFEISFFKDRYSSFYTFSINVENEERKRRLIKKSLTLEQIEAIDANENKENIEGEEQFIAQNIPRCLQIADVHLINPKDEYETDLKLKILKAQLIKYVTLIMHPGLVTPTHVERCMNIAYNAKLNSGCISRQVGAVITNEDYSIISIGWNSVPEGQIPCNLRNINDLINRKNEDDFSEYELKDDEFRKLVIAEKAKIDRNDLGGRDYLYCFKDLYTKLKGEKNQVHTRSLHAEENAFLQISKYGGRQVSNGKLFTTASPCELCSKKAYQLGIKDIYYIDPYPGISKKHILSSGKNRPKMNLYYGAIGSSYVKLYSPAMSIKDELYLLTE